MAMVQIRKHIERLKPLEMFSTREMLAYGKRAAVDTAMFRLVASKEIVRITPGLFVKNDGSGAIPPISDIAIAKATAFSRDIVEISRTLAIQLGCPIDSDADAYFATNGRTTSFKIQKEKKVQFIGAAPRKIALGQSPVGVQLRTFWRLGAERLNAARVAVHAATWSSAEFDECAGRTKELPQWLAEWLGLPKSHACLAAA